MSKSVHPSAVWATPRRAPSMPRRRSTFAAAFFVAALLAVAGVAVAQDATCDAEGGCPAPPESVPAPPPADAATVAGSADATGAGVPEPRCADPPPAPPPDEATLAENAKLRADLAAALDALDALRASTDADPWFPPWIPRRASWIAGEARQLCALASKLWRDLLREFGLLERHDAALDAVAAFLAPHRAALDALLSRVAARLSDVYQLLSARIRKARENVVFLFRELRRAAEERRAHERLIAGLNPEREAREAEKAAYSDDYWRRQRERAGHLGDDLSRALVAAKRAVASRFGDFGRSASDRAETIRETVRTRAVPAIAKTRAALAEMARPAAAELVAKYPEWAERATDAAAAASSAFGFAFGSSASASAAASDEEGKETTTSSASSVDVDHVSAILGDALLACGATSFAAIVLYVGLLRPSPGDHLPDEAEASVKHVPANDGSFTGRVVGGGCDVIVKLPGVRRAAECDILVSEEEVKVKALDGYHDVSVKVPPEAKGEQWKKGTDAWVMSAKFDLRKETLTVSLRTPAKAMAAATASPLAKPAPFSPVLPGKKSPAADKAEKAVAASRGAAKNKTRAAVEE